MLRVVPAQRRPGRSNRPKIDSIIYSLGFGNRESRVDFFALSIPILGYNSCFRPIQRASWGDRKSRHENMSYSLGLESKGRKNRLEFLDFQTLSYKYRNQFRSIFSLHAPLGWKHPEHEELIYREHTTAFSLEADFTPDFFGLITRARRERVIVRVSR